MVFQKLASRLCFMGSAQNAHGLIALQNQRDKTLTLMQLFALVLKCGQRDEWGTQGFPDIGH
jgi:hypothetical protein